MRLEDPDKIDFVGVEKGTGAIVLTLADDFAGNDEVQRLKLLQAKIYRYLDFIESGQVYEHVAKTDVRPAGRKPPVRIQIMAKLKLGEAGEQFLVQVQGVAKKEGVGLSFRVLGG